MVRLGKGGSFPYLPRVQSGRVVLRPAEWKIDFSCREQFCPRAGPADFPAALEQWRRTWAVPRHVYLTSADNRLLLDLEDVRQAAELEAEIAHQKDGELIILQEVIPALGEAWASGPGGSFSTELCLSLVRRSPPARAPAVSHPTHEVSSRSEERQARLFSPGSEWVYLKLYCGPDLHDDLLVGPVRDLAHRLLDGGLAEQWFFIRYTDPDHHLRLRFRCAQPDLRQGLFTELCSWATALLDQGRCLRFAFDTYDREVERYGGREGIVFAEQIFGVDSSSVVEHLALLQRNRQIDPHDLVVATIDNLLFALGLQAAEEIRWLRERRGDKHASGPEYRKRHAVLRSYVAPRDAASAAALPPEIRSGMERTREQMRPLVAGQAESPEPIAAPPAGGSSAGALRPYALQSADRHRRGARAPDAGAIVPDPRDDRTHGRRGHRVSGSAHLSAPGGLPEATRAAGGPRPSPGDLALCPATSNHSGPRYGAATASGSRPGGGDRPARQWRSCRVECWRRSRRCASAVEVFSCLSPRGAELNSVALHEHCMTNPRGVRAAKHSDDRDHFPSHCAEAPMTRTITFSDRAVLGVSFAHDGVISRLRPLIDNLSKALAQGEPLSLAISRLSNVMPEIFRYFEQGPPDEFRLRDEWLFPVASQTALVSYGSRGTGREFSLETGSNDVILSLHEMHAAIGSGRFTTKQLSQKSPLWGRLAKRLRLHDIVATGGSRYNCLRPLHEPGVHRLQHASLLFRSKTTGVLVDPHLHSKYRPTTTHLDIHRAQLEGLVDAILISHSHGDHYDLATLLTFAPETTIIVPDVPRASILAPDMASELRRLGFVDVRTPQWYAAPVRIGDIDVHVLPFYGEQPLRDEPLPSRFTRNWGSSYVISTERIRCWVLIDTGVDPLGSMLEVSERVRRDLGSVDCLASNLRAFAPRSPFYITGQGHYWLALSASQMERFHTFRNQQLTLGPTGVAKICASAQIPFFLPYAHWWGDVGDLCSGSDERRLLGLLHQSLDQHGAGTKIIPWRIGDAFLPSRHTGENKRP